MTDEQIYDLWMSIPSEGTPKVEICRFARALLAASAPNPSDKQEAKPIYQVLEPCEALWSDADWLTYESTDGAFKRIVYAAPLAQSAEQDRIDAEYREVGVWEPDGSKFKTYLNENLNGVAMYVREAKGASK